MVTALLQRMYGGVKLRMRPVDIANAHKKIRLNKEAAEASRIRLANQTKNRTYKQEYLPSRSAAAGSRLIGEVSPPFCNSAQMRPYA